jgi:hypothetical protein
VRRKAKQPINGSARSGVTSCHTSPAPDFQQQQQQQQVHGLLLLPFKKNCSFKQLIIVIIR